MSEKGGAPVESLTKDPTEFVDKTSIAFLPKNPDKPETDPKEPGETPTEKEPLTPEEKIADLEKQIAEILDILKENGLNKSKKISPEDIKRILDRFPIHPDSPYGRGPFGPGPDGWGPARFQYDQQKETSPITDEQKQYEKALMDKVEESGIPSSIVDPETGADSINPAFVYAFGAERTGLTPDEYEKLTKQGVQDIDALVKEKGLEGARKSILGLSIESFPTITSPEAPEKEPLTVEEKVAKLEKQIEEILKILKDNKLEPKNPLSELNPEDIQRIIDNLRNPPRPPWEPRPFPFPYTRGPVGWEHGDTPPLEKSNPEENPSRTDTLAKETRNGNT